MLTTNLGACLERGDDPRRLISGARPADRQPPPPASYLADWLLADVLLILRHTGARRSANTRTDGWLTLSEGTWTPTPGTAVVRVVRDLISAAVADAEALHSAASRAVLRSSANGMPSESERRSAALLRVVFALRAAEASVARGGSYAHRLLADLRDRPEVLLTASTAAGAATPADTAASWLRDFPSGVHTRAEVWRSYVRDGAPGDLARADFYDVADSLWGSARSIRVDGAIQHRAYRVP